MFEICITIACLVVLCAIIPSILPPIASNLLKSKYPLTKFHYHQCDDEGNSEDITIIYKGQKVKQKTFINNVLRLKQQE